MKKIFAGFGLVLITLTVYAFSQISNVHNIGDKDVNGAQESQKIVTASEFNSLVNTVRGINVNKNGSKYEMGLGTNPISGVDLTIGGMLKIDKESDSSECNAVGTIFYNKDNKHFWGCQSIGSVPVRLDVDECTSVNAVCGTTHNNCVSGTFKTGSDNATSTEYTWTCSGISGGVDASCTELIPVNGVCGKTHYNCDAGILDVKSKKETSTAYTWLCDGINGGSGVGCFEDKVIMYNSYVCGEEGWVDNGVISSEEMDECKEKGNEYDEKASYSSGDEVCSLVVPDNKNCGK